ncbi:heterokaryon incompatibility protein-domain-containing protein [Parachaetomium inaequale]|uniref:Heterokaryon incompatibility protein-domain-containing protein n=1 Tax=Parachaetomium inaequale TaxID=2588326 RepID=A0AAN6SKG1_9PEZI|nr:heterokaryon incompatibility protein-domain-containing protein [Parachaetomium inaequale]
MCTYQTNSLPKYVALSYTWGPPQQDAIGYGPDDKVPVLVNGRPLPLFRNLGNTLKSLYRAWDFDDDVQHLWVDAICINQDDEAERASQVNIMDRIYRGAASTCVWLGEESRSQTTAPIFRNILNAASEDFAPYYHQYPSGTPPADVFWHSKGLPCPDDEGQWAPVRRLFQNRWFNRAWVIQEVLLSSNIYVSWGSTWMTWDDLGKMGLMGHVAKLGQHGALPALFQHLSGESTHPEPETQDWAAHDPVTSALHLWLNGHRYL